MRTSMFVGLLAGFILAAAGPPALADPLYPQPFFEVDGNARGVAAGDWNGDGIADLIVGSGRGSVGCAAILLGGTGRLMRQAGCLPVGGDPTAFAVADFDGDGHADIAIGWWQSYYPTSGGVTVYLGIGDGTFRPGAGLADAGHVASLATGDFDGDGHLDLALATLSSDTEAPYAAVLRGQGDGGFGPAIWELRTGQQVLLVAADFDGDGRSDLATCDGSGSLIEIYLGTQGGALQKKAAYSAGQVPQSIQTADVDGDAHPDLVIGFVQDQQVRVLIGLGNGLFSPQPATSLGEPAGMIAIGDFDGDGRLDVAVARILAPGVFLLAGDGRGELRIAGVLDAKADALAALDADGDGLTDLAATSGTGVAILRALGDFAAPTNITVASGTVVRGALAADFNRDGRDDLAVFYPYSGEIYLYAGRGDGGFAEPIELQTGMPQSVLRAGDFNGDGNLDLASIGYGAVVTLLGNGRGGFAPPRMVAVPTFIIKDGAVADVDDNGLDDVVVIGQVSPTDAAGYAVPLMAGPDGALHPGIYSDAGHRPQSLALADIDGDGRTDLVITNLEQSGYTNQGALTIVPGMGDGTFGWARTMPLDGIAAGIVARDLNGDASIDLVIALSGTSDIPAGALSVLMGTGGGGLAPEKHYAATVGPRVVVARDLDGNGTLDLATVGYFGGDVAVLRGDGSGSFGPREAYATGLTLESLAAGDFDGDGLGDLALTNQNTTYTDGKLIVLPGRPPFPCLPVPGDEAGRCTQDVTDARLDLKNPLARGASLVTWGTSHEYDVTGFNVVEIDVSGEYVHLNAVTIPCVECITGGGATYSFPIARHRGVREIFVELLRRSGPPRRFGPVSTK